VKETKQGRDADVAILDMKEAGHHPFFLIFVGSSQEGYALLSAPLPEFPRALAPLGHWNSIAKFLDERAVSIIGDGSVDLSGLSAKGFEPDLNGRDVVSFVVFYAGALARKNRQKIETLGFVNEPIKLMNGFGYVKDHFPDLTKLVVRTDWTQQKGYDELSRKLAIKGIALETAEEFSVGTRLEAQRPNAWTRFLMEQGPLNVINLTVGDVAFPVSSAQLRETCELFRSRPQLLSQPNYVVRTATSPGVFEVFRLALDRVEVEVTPEICDELCALAREFGFHSLLADLILPEIQLDPESPVDAFLLEFLNCSWTALATIGQHYVEQAVFSLSVALHGPFSPLDDFDRFGHYAGDDAAGNVLMCPHDIACGLVEIFGDACWAKPSHRSVRHVGVGAAVVIEGTLIRTGIWLKFDRSLLLFHCDDGAIRIANDHLYLREADPE
jgi:hypothetical protein